MSLAIRRMALCLGGLLLLAIQPCHSQIDPIARNLLQLGYDQPLEGSGPQALYAYYYHNNPDFIRMEFGMKPIRFCVASNCASPSRPCTSMEKLDSNN